jgi:hypothetical protein
VDAFQEDMEFCKEDLINPQVVDQWLKPGNSGKILSIVAIDLETNGPILSGTYHSRNQLCGVRVGYRF